MVQQDTLKTGIAGNGKHAADSFTVKHSDSLRLLKTNDTLRKNTGIKKQAAVKTPGTGTQTAEISNTGNPDFCRIDPVSEIIGIVADTNSPVLITRTEEFPVSFTRASETLRNKVMAEYASARKEGIPRNDEGIKSDWMLPLVLLATLIFIFLRNLPGNFLKNAIGFLTLRSPATSFSRETGKLSDIQSILFGINICICSGLFSYIAARYFNISLPGMNETGTMIALVAFSFFFISARMIIVNLTGIISEQKQIFSEYRQTVQTFYRIAGIMAFFLSVMTIYSGIFSEKVWIITGFITLLLLYFLRIIRLFIIFINKSASLLYLIFYLCALEILPVAVLVKYLSGVLQDL